MALTVDDKTLQTVIDALADPARREAALPVAERWLVTINFVGDQRSRLEAAAEEPQRPPGLIVL